MPKVIDYKIITSDAASDLERVVKYYIGSGWQPLGQPYARESMHPRWFQVVVKYQ